MNDLEGDELVVLRFDGDCEEEGGVPLVHHLLVRPLEEGGHLGLASQDQGDQVLGDLLLRLSVVGWGVPLLQSQLPLATEEQHEVDHLG